VNYKSAGLDYKGENEADGGPLVPGEFLRRHSPTTATITLSPARHYPFWETAGVKRFLPLLGAALVAWLPSPALAIEPEKAKLPESFTLKDGDRVVLVGNTLVEREQRSGYWELALTTRFPASNVQFRNLGWSGDTVWGQARASFGTPADGFKQLKEHVAALKPTVIIVGYGNNEAFDGEAGLTHFLDGLNILLDTLAENKARMLLLSPLRQEDMGRPLPDPTEQNANIRLYRDAMKKVADKRGYPFVDFCERLPEATKANQPVLLTDNGIHLTPFGYWRSALALQSGLGADPVRWAIDIEPSKKKATCQGATAVCTFDEEGPRRFKVTDETLPFAPSERQQASKEVPAATRILRVHGLPQGKFTLTIDGKEIMTATTKQWDEGVRIEDGPEFEQAEKLREAIIEKNRLYFHRWRPQNETYLFGFRKHEQGQNAVEIPKFDPLVAKQEEEIAKLRVPVAHTYEIKPAQEGKR
jgi:lysophospholipase L1-like esterase